MNKNQILSIYGRNDDHKETGGNKTYKLNFTQLLGPMKLGLTHSTGLKNASLYELYGNIGQKNINPEKSETNEISSEYSFSENIKFSSTAYRTRMRDRITDWIKKWKLNNWKNSKKKPVKNKDLWIKLDNICLKHKVSWKWVKAHAGNKYNNLVDELAVLKTK